eukprot:378544_1
MDKWKQCVQIYEKFIGYESYYSVNIGYEAAQQIDAKYQTCIRYKQSNCSADIGVNVEQDIITNDEEFQNVIMDMFDCAIVDVVKNLNDSVKRFVRTDTFKLLNG